MLRTVTSATCAAALIALGACSEQGSSTTTSTTSPRSSDATTTSKGGVASAGDEQDHGHSHGESVAAPPDSAGHGGPVIELGTASIAGFTVRASRDRGAITPGGDAPIDTWLIGVSADIAAVTAVRFWIGTEQGAESIKARAEIENPAEPNRWHTHAEVPNPLPAGSSLWVEIEIEGAKHIGSFALAH